MKRYIAFYDSTCGLCNFSVQLFLALDKRGVISFAPLSGTTAEKELADWRKQYPTVDSIVFLSIDTDRQKKRISFWSRAVFSFFYALGGLWTLPGLLSFLPKPLLYPADVVYRFIASRRRDFCPYVANKDQYKERFLP